MRRALMTLGVAAALLALALPGQASGDVPPITVVGVGTQTGVPTPGTVSFRYAVTVTGAPATNVVVTTAQDPLLPADITSIRLDDATVPTATVTASAPDFTLRAGTGASDTAGGTLGVGTHTLTFTAQATGTAPAQASSTLTVTADGGSVTSAPVVVPLNEPDLSLKLPPDSGEDAPAPLGTGQSIYFDAELRNLGSPSPGTLTVTLPTGLQLGSDGVFLYADEAAWEDGDGTQLPCTGTAGTATCALDTVPTTVAGRPAIVEVDLEATSAGQPGTSATFTVAVTPTTATDTNPADNSVQATLDFTGVADLTFGITPGKATVQIGHTSVLTLHVTNHGPQTAPMALGLSVLDSDKSFIITDFDGDMTPPGLTGLSRIAAIRAARHNLAAGAPRGADVAQLSAGFGAAAAPPSPLGVLWFIGDLAPGATATAHLTVRAEVKGRAHLALFAGSGAADPGCVTEDDPCRPALATLTAVKAAAKPAPDDSSHAPIANTGSADADLTLLGGILLLAGVAMTVAARRRTTRT